MNLFGTPLSAAVAAILFAGSSPDDPNIARWQQSLRDARDISVEAAGMASAGKDEEAVRLYEDAMIFGRKAALALHEDGAETSVSSDGETPLDWLIALYRNSSLTRIKLQDVDGARKDAWGACLYSQNEDIASLECLEKVCEAGEDDMGQLMALKNILQLDEKASQLDSERRKEIESSVDALKTKLMS